MLNSKRALSASHSRDRQSMQVKSEAKQIVYEYLIAEGCYQTFQTLQVSTLCANIMPDRGEEPAVTPYSYGLGR